MTQEKQISGTANSNVFYFVCPLPSCTLLKFDSFKATNMHIIEKLSTEDWDEELLKAKKMKKKPAAEEVISAIAVSQRIDFAAAQHVVKGATVVTQPTISVKKEEEAKSKETLV